MTQQDIYDVAEWLCYNRDKILANLGEYENTGELLHKLIYYTRRHYPNVKQIHQDEFDEAFEDERVLLIFDFYYVKQKGSNYEH